MLRVPVCVPMEVGAKRTVMVCCQYGFTVNGALPALMLNGADAEADVTFKLAEPVLAIVTGRSSFCPLPTLPKLSMLGGTCTLGPAALEARQTSATFTLGCAASVLFTVRFPFCVP